MADSAQAAAPSGGATTEGAATKPAWKKPKKKPQDVGFYELLEVQWDAAPDEIRRAYHKRALKLHPDKGGDPAQFHAMKRAYDVLSDDKKRSLYDNYGPEWLKVMEGEAGPQVYLMLLLKQRRFRALVVFIGMLFVGFLVLFPVLQAVRWDGADWSWAIVFIPIWLILGIAFLIQLQLLFAAGPAPEGEEGSTPAKVEPPAPLEVLVTVLLFSSAIIFFAFLSVQLDGTVLWNWFAVMIPWYIFEVVLCIQRFLGARRAVVELRAQLESVKEGQNQIIREAKDGLELGDLDAALRIHEAEETLKEVDKDLDNLRVSGLYLAVAFFWPTLRFITAFLIAGKAQGSYPGSWFLTAIPFMFGVAIYPILEAFRAADEPEEGSPFQVWCFTGLQYGVALLIWLLGMAKMDNWFIFSAFAVWGPYFVVCGLILCNISLVLCVDPDTLVKQDQQQGGEAAQEQGEATGAKAAGATSEANGVPTTKDEEAAAPPNVIILT